MSHRIDVELTSVREDGSWTWRAAGARQPKGVVEGAVLYEGAKVGDVVRAEADFELEGISISSVVPPKEKKRAEPERLEIIGSPSRQEGVTTSVVRRSGRPERGRGDGDGARRRPRRDGDDASSDRPRRERSARQPRSAGEGRARRGDGRPGGRPAGARTADDASAERRQDGRRRGARRDGEPGGGGAGRSSRQRDDSGDGGGRTPRPKRLSPATVHRDAALAGLSPEQRAIAEQVLKGGIPAVRQAIEAQNDRARSANLPEVNGEALLALAEELLPRLKAATWRDRADAAAGTVDEISLRDLRSVVAGADTATRDDESRLLASSLREALERRVARLREQWVEEITRALDEGRLVRALRVSAHPPEPTARFPADLAVRMSDAAGEAMTPETSTERWTTLLGAVADSPIRRMVKPRGLPRDPANSVVDAARQASGRVPALAIMLGIDMPPPPGPPRPHSPRPPRPAVDRDRRAG
jgi:hypothetical protein